MKMSVTPRSKPPRKNRETKGLKRPAELKELADFLNYDFDKNPNNWRAPDNPLFFLHLKAAQPDLNEVKTFQKEISKDLEVLIAPKYLGDLDFSIDRLIDKINGLNIVNNWDGFPSGAAWISRHGGLRWSAHDQPPHPVRLFDRVVRIAGFKWILRKTPVANSLRAKVYHFVMEALETDTFSNLRKCKQCLRFFVAHDAREKVCRGGDCAKIRDRIATNLKMKRYRHKLAEDKHRKGINTLRHVASVIEKNPDLSITTIHDNEPIIQKLQKRLGELYGDFENFVMKPLARDPRNIQAVWDNVPPKLKSKLAEGT
jgi:hypothetical protein